MSLDKAKLESVRELGNGGWQARCPACAESGQDRKGEHLRISADGKFGCCVFPGDHEHRRRIFALAGEHGPKDIKVRVAAAKESPALQLDLSAFAAATVEDLGRLGRAGRSEECKVQSAEWQPEEVEGGIGTVGTCVSDPRACGNEPDLYMGKLIGSEEPVPSVPRSQGAKAFKTGRRLPFLMGDGTVVIPFNSPERYHWWKGGQAISRTVAELRERRELEGSPF